MPKKKITDVDVLALLRTRHLDHVFIPECSTGSSCKKGYGRIDAWAMKKGYSRPVSWGYEIKTTRNDFIKDEKWHKYLDFCNHFYFICPWNVIKKGEVPKIAGLIYITSTGTRLITKKKSPYREVEIPGDFFRSILFNRAKICRASEIYNRIAPTKEQNVEYWKEWLGRKEENRNLGYMVSQKIRDYVYKVERENGMLKEQMGEYDKLRERIKELGFPVDRPVSSWRIGHRIEELKEAIPAGLEPAVERTILALQQFQKAMGKISNERQGS